MASRCFWRGDFLSNPHPPEVEPLDTIILCISLNRFMLHGVLLTERNLACPRCNRRIPERAWRDLVARAACQVDKVNFAIFSDFFRFLLAA